jgi:hypothetical protein
MQSMPVKGPGMQDRLGEGPDMQSMPVEGPGHAGQAGMEDK